MEMGASELCMEFTIYSGSSNTTAQDIVHTLKTDPPPGFTVQTNRINDMELCADAEKGCNLDDSDGDGDSLLYIVIGVACFVILFLLGIAWYVIHKQVRRQWSTRTGDMVAGDTLTIRSTWLQGENENMSTFKSRADATGLQNSASSRDDVITPPFGQEEKTGAVSSNDLVEINIHPRGRGSSDEDREKIGAAVVGSSASVATCADSHNSSPDLPGSLAQIDDMSFSSSSSSEN
jgi:hypothetical protein